MVPPCSSTRLRTRVSPIPSPPCDAVEREVGLGEQVEDARRASRALRPIPVSRTGSPARRPRRSAVRAIWPPGSVYLAALFRRFATTCSSRVGSPSQPAPARPGRLTVRSMAAWPRSAGVALSTACARRVEVDRRLAELDLALGEPRDVEQVVEEAGHVPDLPLGDLERLAQVRGAVGPPAADDLEGSCGSAPGGCAARGRASPGTRPCAGRPPPAPRPGAAAPLPRRRSVTSETMQSAPLTAPVGS